MSSSWPLRECVFRLHGHTNQFIQAQHLNFCLKNIWSRSSAKNFVLTWLGDMNRPRGWATPAQSLPHGLPESQLACPTHLLPSTGRQAPTFWTPDQSQTLLFTLLVADIVRQGKHNSCQSQESRRTRSGSLCTSAKHVDSVAVPCHCLAFGVGPLNS